MNNESKDCGFMTNEDERNIAEMLTKIKEGNSCYECGVNFSTDVEQCGYIYDLTGKTTDLWPSCAICMVIHKIEGDLRTLKHFVRMRQK